MMRNILGRLGPTVIVSLAASAAFAHAQLQSAEPPVGGTASAPKEIRLTFSEGVAPHFSGVKLTAESGAAEPTGRPRVDPANDRVLIVHVSKSLPPGSYTVHWHAVSVDTHHTQGSFDFTVK